MKILLTLTEFQREAALAAILCLFFCVCFCYVGIARTGAPAIAKKQTIQAPHQIRVNPEKVTVNYGTY